MSARTTALLVALLLAGTSAAMGADDPTTGAADELRPIARSRTWIAPEVDVEHLLEQDQINAARKDIPHRVGFPMSSDLAPSRDGIWKEHSGGGQTWQLELRSEGALWVVLGFDHFRLQSGASVEILDQTSRTVHGPYTAADVREHGQLWIPPVEGAAAIVELRWPEELRGVEPELRLGTVTHGYKTILDYGLPNPEAAADGVSGSCNIDVNCSLGNDWQDEKRGVVMLVIGATGAQCSGSLVNNTNNDCTPYVLTADHCFGQFGGTGPFGNPASSIFFFNREAPSCGSGQAPPTVSLSGSVERAGWTGSDHTLLELDDPIPDSFNAYFNGWSRSTTPASEAWTIHHPQGDVKKISFDSGPLVTSPGGLGGGLNFWRVNNWEQGTTEGGSSGGPLFDQNSRIVGQLLGGTASCVQLTWDEYGKFDRSWNGLMTASTRLSDWLDPAGTNPTVLDGIDYSACEACSSPADCNDLVSCTVDTCVDMTCVHTPDDNACDDMDPCTINTCDPVGGCTSTPRPDGDSDGTCDIVDNCPATSNPVQEDFDSDGLGDACETGAVLADADHSDRVDGFDLAMLAVGFGGSTPRDADFNRSGMIDGDDLAILATYFGQSVP